VGPLKKRACVSRIAISSFFFIVNKFKRDDATQLGFLEDLMLIVMKGMLHVRIIEYISL